VGARISSSFQTGPEAHPASCTMGTGSFPGVKRPGSGVDHSPQPAPTVKKEWSHTSTPPVIILKVVIFIRQWTKPNLSSVVVLILVVVVMVVVVLVVVVLVVVVVAVVVVVHVVIVVVGVVLVVVVVAVLLVLIVVVAVLPAVAILLVLAVLLVPSPLTTGSYRCITNSPSFQ